MSLVGFLSSLDIPSVLISAVVILSCYLVFQRWWESRVVPPGPWGLPILGYGVFLDPTLYKSFDKLSKKYGNIFSLRFGQRLTIIVNSYDAIKDVFIKHGDVFHGKPSFFTLQGWFSDFSGVMVEDGQAWKDQRRFLLSTLRDFGFGKGAIAEKIQNEGQTVVEVFRSQEGKPFDPQLTFANCTANIISALIFGKQLPYDDPRFLRLREVMNFQKMPKRTLLLFLLPWLRFIPFPFLVGWDVLQRMKKALHDFVEEEIQEHRDTFDENNLRDVIDVYILDAKKAGEGSWMTDLRLQANILGLYSAGQETVSMTLYWSLILMVVYPDIQETVQRELDSVVGFERLPECSDRPKLPFTEAVISEIQRYSSIVPINLEHCNTEEVHINGRIIPSRCLIFANLYSALRDPKYWKNPMEFDPHNFLDKDGKPLKNEAFIQFSIGKHACLGESLARMELFLFFTIMLQRFKFTPPEGEELKIEESKSLFDGRLPGNYKICATPRF